VENDENSTVYINNTNTCGNCSPCGQ